MRAAPILAACLVGCMPLRCSPPDNPERFAQGRARWIFRIEGTPTRGALLRDGAVVFGDSRGRVRRLTADGSERWSADVEGFVTAVASSPDGALLYTGVGRRGGAGAVLALDARTGRERWEHPTSGFPLPAVAPDGTIILAGEVRPGSAGAAGTVSAIAPGGALHWARDVGKELASAPAAIAADGSIAVALADGTIVGLSAGGEERWRTGDARLAGAVSLDAMPGGGFALLSPRAIAIGSADGRIARRIDGAWRGRLGVAPDGRLVAASAEGRVVAWSPDGRERWRRRYEKTKGTGERREVVETPVDAAAAPDGGALVVVARGDERRLRRLVRLDARGRVLWSERLVGIVESLARPFGTRDGRVIAPTAHWNERVAKTSAGPVGHHRITCFRD